MIKSYPYRLDGFMDWLYEQKSGAESALLSDDTAIIAKNRQKLKTMLGIDKLEAIAVRSEPELVSTDVIEGLTIRSMAMEILPKLTMPFYVVEPEKSKGKSVLYCHGHGAGGLLDCFDRKDPPAYHKYIPLTLAKRGYTVYAFEPVGFGELVIENFQLTEGIYTVSPCYPISTILMMHGITLNGLRVYEAMRVADYIEGKGEIFATTGISGGGLLAATYAALDDRVAAAAVSCYTCMYRDCLMAMRHCVCNFLPGNLDLGEMPHVMALMLPKPLFISAGERDPLFPVEGVRKATKIIREIYAKHAPDASVELEVFEGEHEYSEAFIDWLDEVL